VIQLRLNFKILKKFDYFRHKYESILNNTPITTNSTTATTTKATHLNDNEKYYVKERADYESMISTSSSLMSKQNNHKTRSSKESSESGSESGSESHSCDEDDDDEFDFDEEEDLTDFSGDEEEEVTEELIPADSNNKTIEKKSARTFYCFHCEKRLEYNDALMKKIVLLEENYYHKDCVKCCVCNEYLKENEVFIKGPPSTNLNNEKDEEKRKCFYCKLHLNHELNDESLELKRHEEKHQEKQQHHSFSKNSSPCSIGSTTSSLSTTSSDFNSNRLTMSEPSKINNKNTDSLLDDISKMRQQALEKARLKSDEELGLTKSPSTIDKMMILKKQFQIPLTLSKLNIKCF
jgi:hypothetical protein